MENPILRRSDGERFPHFMLKEIYEQPAMVRGILQHWVRASGRFIAPTGFFSPQEMRRLSKVTIAASGSSRHAGLVAKFMLETLAGVLVEVDFASQYCYRDSVVWPDELTVLNPAPRSTLWLLFRKPAAKVRSAWPFATCLIAH
jgi:glutamine---fructose-6-phosphate transaminase (isomerizing)